MLPPIFPACAASPEVTSLLGTEPVRFYPWGEAPQDKVYPYAVWQVIPGGAPGNNLHDRPDFDVLTIQVDVYGRAGSAVSDVVRALRDAIEPHARIVRWGVFDTDPDTKSRHGSFDVRWWLKRDT